MVYGSHGMHHLHKRLRNYQKHEPYPSSDSWIRTIDHIVYATVFIGLLMSLPQVAKVWMGKNASGLSLVSWVTYIFTNAAWMLYGFVHRDKTIFFASLLWIFVHLAIVVGIVLYG